jgi:hypothetical protein
MTAQTPYTLRNAAPSSDPSKQERKLFAENQKPEWLLNRWIRKPIRARLHCRSRNRGHQPQWPLDVDNTPQEFPGLKRDPIEPIHHSKFIPRLLFKMLYAQGVNTDRRTQKALIRDGKIEVAAKDYLKDYTSIIIWTEGFVNYAAISVLLGLHIALSRFMLDIDPLRHPMTETK